MSDNEKAHSNSTQTFPAPAPARPCNVANPATLGLLSFASTTLILSLYNVNARGIAEPNVVVGMAIFCGGLAQLLAGMWEFPRANMFGATAFSSYGAFWMSFATILIPGSGTVAAFKKNDVLDEAQFHNALGIYLITWFIVTFILLIASLRKNIAFISLFGFLSLTFILLAAANFVGKKALEHAGGALGIVTAMVAYYIALSELLASDKHSIITLPLGVFQHE